MKEKVEQWYQEQLTDCLDSMSVKMLNGQYQQKLRLVEEGKDPFPENNKTSNDDGIECVGCGS